MCATFLSSSVISISLSLFNKCEKPKSSFCLMMTTNLYIVNSSFYKFLASEVASSFKSRLIKNHQLVLTGTNALKPPITAFVPVNCCKHVSIKHSILLPTIDISSIMTTFRCLYFILNVFNSLADRMFVPCHIFLWNAEQIV